MSVKRSFRHLPTWIGTDAIWTAEGHLPSTGILDDFTDAAAMKTIGDIAAILFERVEIAETYFRNDVEIEVARKCRFTEHSMISPAAVSIWPSSSSPREGQRPSSLIFYDL